MFIIYKIQKWMDTMAGQTFMQYAYSWGAAVVILGTLFKLTHLPGANIMLFLGMGTEVLVFVLSGFERVTDKSEEHAVPSNQVQQIVIPQGNPVVAGYDLLNEPYCSYRYSSTHSEEELHSIFSAGAGGVTKLKAAGGKKLERIFNFKYSYEYVSRFHEMLERKDGIEKWYEQFRRERS